MPNEISQVNIFERISDKLDKYLEIKDVVLENDLFEVLSDSASILKVLKKKAVENLEKRIVN